MTDSKAAAAAAPTPFAGTILVLGATGKVGTPLIHSLLALGAKRVRVLARDVAKTKAALGDNAALEYVLGDTKQVDSVKAALKGVERIFLLTDGLASVEGPLAKAAKDANVKLLVKISVSGASHDEPHSSLLRWHAESEDAVHATGVPYVFLRPGFFIQNYLGDAQSIKHGALYRPDIGAFHATHIDTRDIADAAATLLTTPDADLGNVVGKTFHLDGPAFTLSQVAAVFSKVLGKDVKYVALPDADFFKTLQGFGVPQLLAFALLRVYQTAREGTFNASHGDLQIITGKPYRALEAWVHENKAVFSS